MTWNLFWELVWEGLHHALEDSVVLVPILFLTYLLIEYIEHHMSQKMEHMIRRAGRLGPLLGGALGILPQCGLSGAAAGFYAARAISTGTLFAIFLATSDEMLPILISSGLPIPRMLMILGIKFSVGVAVGFLVDLILSRHRRVEVSEGLGQFGKEHAETHRHGIIRGALMHTLTIMLIIIATSALIHIGFEVLGEDRIAAFVPDIPFVGELLAALIGLIPNCSPSVMLTELYVKGVIGIGPMLAGLFVNGGVGMLILWKSNRNKKENLVFTASLYAVSVLAGTLIGLIPGL